MCPTCLQHRVNPRLPSLAVEVRPKDIHRKVTIVTMIAQNLSLRGNSTLYDNGEPQPSSGRTQPMRAPLLDFTTRCNFDCIYDGSKFSVPIVAIINNFGRLVPVPASTSSMLFFVSNFTKAGAGAGSRAALPNLPLNCIVKQCVDFIRCRSASLTFPTPVSPLSK
jgi:hypothetical protein